MGESYPRRDQARGLWKINNITKNIKEEGTYPQASSQSSVLFAGGATPSNSNVIEFITLASLGNSIDFGDQGTASQAGRGCASSIRFCYNLGSPNGNTIEYVTIATQGDAVDFGDLTEARQPPAGVSNGHGGL